MRSVRINLETNLTGPEKQELNYYVSHVAQSFADKNTMVGIREALDRHLLHDFGPGFVVTVLDDDGYPCPAEDAHHMIVNIVYNRVLQ